MLAAGWSEHHSTVQGTLSSLSGQPFYLQGHPTMCDVMRTYVCNRIRIPYNCVELIFGMYHPKDTYVCVACLLYIYSISQVVCFLLLSGNLVSAFVCSNASLCVQHH